jgi:hypothetical protein
MSNESDLRLGLSLMRIINRYDSNEDDSTVIDLNELDTIRVDKMDYDKIQQATIENIPNIQEKEEFIKQYYQNINLQNIHMSVPNQDICCSSKDTIDEYIDLIINSDNIQIAQEYYYETNILERKVIKNNDNYIFSCIFMIMIKDVMFNIDKNCVKKVITVFKDNFICLLNENKFSFVKKVLCLTNDQHVKKMLNGLAKPLFVHLHEKKQDSLYNDVLFIYNNANILLKDKLKNKN